MRRRIATTLVAAAAAFAGTVGPAAAVAVPGDTIAGFLPEPATPQLNDPTCRPSADHPDPVVLVHGLGATATENWHFFAPYLADTGRCVYAFTYGEVSMWPGRGGIAPMEKSAAQLSVFVDQVLAETHAKKVDIVGHSEGGIMPRYYLKFLGGAAKVDHFVAWAPPNHGTNINHLTDLRAMYPAFDGQMAQYCGSCPEFMPGSDFLRHLNAGVEAPGPTKYTVIATRYDWIVTPLETSFLKGAKNLVVQDENPSAMPDHIAMAFDPTTFDMTVRALNLS